MPIQPARSAGVCSCPILSNKFSGEHMNTFQVINVGKMWRIVDRSKGRKVVGFGSTAQGALAKAEELEAKLRIATEYLIASRKVANEA